VARFPAATTTLLEKPRALGLQANDGMLAAASKLYLQHTHRSTGRGSVAGAHRSTAVYVPSTHRHACRSMSDSTGSTAASDHGLPQSLLLPRTRRRTGALHPLPHLQVLERLHGQHVVVRPQLGPAARRHERQELRQLGVFLCVG